MPKSNKNILFLTYWSYKDALVQSCVVPYFEIIRKYTGKDAKFYLVTFEQSHLKVAAEEKQKLYKALEADNIYLIDFEYTKPGIKAVFLLITAFVRLLKIILVNRVKYLHVFCAPPGVLGYFLSILTGRMIIADSYEPHAESMIENGTWSRNSSLYKFLFWVERLLSKRARWIVATTEGMRSYAREKYEVIFENNYFVKPACVDLDLFSEFNKKKSDLVLKYKLENKIICVYAGKFGSIYLDKEVFDFFAEAKKYWGDKFHVVLLTNHSKEYIQELCKVSSFDYACVTQLFVPHIEVPDYLGLGDFAITPVKPVPSKRYCTPIKNGEYWALGLPVVIPANISDDSDIIKRYDIGAILESLDAVEYRKAIIKIDQLLKEYPGKEMYNKIRPIAEKYRSYAIADRIYEYIYGLNKDLPHV